MMYLHGAVRDLRRLSILAMAISVVVCLKRIGLAARAP